MMITNSTRWGAPFKDDYDDDDYILIYIYIRFGETLWYN